jgi:hypothetical protein
MDAWVEKLQSATGQPPSEHSRTDSNTDHQNGMAFVSLCIHMYLDVILLLNA